MGQTEQCDNLRQALKTATASAHDRLDGTMRTVAGWTTKEDYARFLALQHAARRPVETWLEIHAPSDLRPPAQCPLIAADLAELGHQRPERAVRFDPPMTLSGAKDDRAVRAMALGTAWVLAGSSLGNRAILTEIGRMAERKQWQTWPSRFLSDARMLAYWKGLRRRIEDRAEMDAVGVAIDAAMLVFDHFIAHANASRQGLKRRAAGRVPDKAQTAQGAS